jgi:hypothetical protein
MLRGGEEHVLAADEHLKRTQHAKLERTVAQPRATLPRQAGAEFRAASGPLLRLRSWPP